MVHTQIETETENGSTSQSEYTYDEYGRITEENISSNGKTTETEYVYNVWGYEEFETVVETENGICTNSSTAFYEYDALGRCISEVYSDFNTDNEQTLYAYNPLDDVIFEKVGNEVTRTVYDDYGRVVQEIEAQDYSATSDGISLDNDGYPTGSDSYTNPNAGHRYVYDSQTRLLTSETNRLGVQTDYTYHPNSSTVATESFDIYRYEYTTDGKLEYIYVAASAIPYAHYVYDNNNNTEIRYGNGQTVYFAYDVNGNIVSQSYTGSGETNSVTQFSYTYNSDNELTSKLDYINNRRTDYSGNTVSVYDTSGNSDVLLYSYTKTEEDTAQNLPATESKDFAGNTLNVTCGDNNNQYKLNNSDVFSVSNTFNNDDMLSSTVINNPSNNPIVSKSFTYDNNNNVTSVTVNNTTVSYVYDDDLITEYHQGNNAAYYHYDNKEQLVREDINYVNYSKTITYTYDNRGNLTEKKEYPFTRSENLGTPLEENGLEFEYEDELWLDEIVETPTATILYDENGNPVNLEDCTLEWTNGRQLKSVSNGNNVILEYTYDENGIRASKTYQGITTYYTTENGIITSQYQLDSNGNKENEVIFIYDNGVLVSAYYDSAMYYYITNAMGDVISIIDENGNTVVDYCYDAWGNTVDRVVNTNLSTDFATVNPMLYRSYYYDEDLGVYYLQSRYYKADWCRFINSDLPTYAKKQINRPSGTNLFVYCCNNPIKYLDPTGNFIILFILIIKSISVTNIISKYKGYTYFSVSGKRISSGYIGVKIELNGFYKDIYESCMVDADLTYSTIASYADELFYNKYNRHIYYTNDCMKQEIKLHVDAFFWYKGFTDYNSKMNNMPFPTTLYFGAWLKKEPGSSTKQQLYNSTRIIDIYESEAYSAQAIAFNYYNGIRKEYKNTTSDPYYNKDKSKRYSYAYFLKRSMKG